MPAKPTPAQINALHPSGTFGFADAFIQPKIDAAARKYGNVTGHSQWFTIVGIQTAYWLANVPATGGGNQPPASALKRAKLRDKELEWHDTAGPDGFGETALGLYFKRQLLDLQRTLPPGISVLGGPPTGL